MTANPEPTLHERIDAMVREKVKQRRVSSMAGKSHLFIYPLVALKLDEGSEDA